MRMLEIVQPETLFDRYDGLLIDAYGVLVNSTGQVPGAGRFIAAMRERGLPFRIITNDASKLEKTASRAYAERGVALEADSIITAGSILEDYFDQHELHGARTLVLGPPDSTAYVVRAGGEPVVLDGVSPFEVLVLASPPRPLAEALDAALSQLIVCLEGGFRPRLVCPNPDVIYPSDRASFGFAAGGYATMIEEALAHRSGDSYRFDRLGKPHPAIFERALATLPPGDYAVLGDQLATDVRGALNMELDVYLSLTGVTTRAALESSDISPTALLGAFA